MYKNTYIKSSRKSMKKIFSINKIYKNIFSKHIILFKLTIIKKYLYDDKKQKSLLYI